MYLLLKRKVLFSHCCAGAPVSRAQRVMGEDEDASSGGERDCPTMNSILKDF